MLSGSIPANLTAAAPYMNGYAVIVDLSHNQLTSIPPFWTTSPGKEFLGTVNRLSVDLSHNRISWVNTSEWPWAYYDGGWRTFIYTPISRLSISHNRLEGLLNTLPGAGAVDLSNNLLTGTLSASLLDTVEDMVFLYNNSFEGKLLAPYSPTKSVTCGILPG